MANKYDWLKQLKPGDPVVIFHCRFGCSSYNLKEVERLTPSGIIVVNGLHYRPTDGQLRGSDDAWGVTELLNYQDLDVKEKLLKYGQVRYVSNLCDMFQGVTPTYDQARQIAQIMGWSEEDLK